MTENADGGPGAGSGRAGPGTPGSGGPGQDSAGAEPDGLLADVRRLRRQARATRNAYWLPLVLFGVLICASAPFYIQSPVRNGAIFATGPFIPFYGGFPSHGWQGYLAYYWLAAIAVGLGVTWFWYRRHGRRVGLVTPARGYLITGAVVALIALLLPVVANYRPGGFMLIPGDLFSRGTFPLVIIATGMWALAWAERSRGLVVICLLYTGSAVLASLYDIENLLFRLGWNPSRFQSRLTTLPNVLLPALVLLIGGAVALMAQRRERSAA